MNPAASADKRLPLVRLLLWIGVFVAAWAFYGRTTSWAWRAPAFAALFTLVSLILSRRDPDSRTVFAVDLAVDLLATTLLIQQTGGFQSPFLVLYFLPTVEGFVRFGANGALGAALAAVLLALINLRFDLASHDLLLYGTTVGAQVGAALLLRLIPVPAPPPPPNTVLKERTVEDVEKQVEALEEQNRQLRAVHRETTAALRDRQSASEDLETGLTILTISLEEEEPEPLHRRLLARLMEAVGAGGAALWLEDQRGEHMEVHAVAGQVAPIVRDEPVPLHKEMQPSDIRRACEGRLRIAAPLSPPAASQKQETAASEDIIDQVPERATTTLGSVLRAEERVFGVVALCGAQAGRFKEADFARLAALVPHYAQAVQNVERTARLRRSVREVSFLHEMSELTHADSEPDQLYDSLVEIVGKMVAYENCTVFIFDTTEKRLIARATRGRVVNLIDHIPFEHGTGISGWVLQKRKQVFIPDLTRETGLMNVEMIPPRIRSFVSVPMIAHKKVIGVLNVSHSQPNAFTPEDARLLALLGGQAARTIERHEALWSLEQKAIKDSLTNLYNHGYFQMRFANEVKRARRYHQNVSLLMLDLDHFKSVNDRYGHSAGDLALTEVARLLQQKVRETNIVARYGGEEMAIILPQTNANEAIITAERLRSAVAEHRFQAAEGTAFTLTFSIGLAAFPVHADSAESLLQKADTALYAAKEAGRNRVCIAEG